MRDKPDRKRSVHHRNGTILPGLKNMNAEAKDSDRNRYERQTPIIGQAGQTALEAASAAIIGLGGLGSPAATYMAAVGFGELILVDHDLVSLPDLNRQFVHRTDDVNLAKSESARNNLKELNPEVSLETRELELDENTISALPETDLIVGSVDNFQARFLLNELAVERGIPYIHGAVEGFRGQLTTVIPGESPCLHCIFSEAPTNEDSPPVLGVAAGVIGTLMASEAIKYVAETGDLMAGKFLTVDLADNAFEVIKLERNPDCPTCGSP